MNWIDWEQACGQALHAGAEEGLCLQLHKVKQTSHCSVWRGVAAGGACETTDSGVFTICGG